MNIEKTETEQSPVEKPTGGHVFLGVKEHLPAGQEIVGKDCYAALFIQGKERFNLQGWPENPTPLTAAPTYREFCRCVGMAFALEMKDVVSHFQPIINGKRIEMPSGKHVPCAHMPGDGVAIFRTFALAVADVKYDPLEYKGSFVIKLDQRSQFNFLRKSHKGIILAPDHLEVADGHIFHDPDSASIHVRIGSGSAVDLELPYTAVIAVSSPTGLLWERSEHLRDLEI